MKKEFWVLYNGKEVILDHEGSMAIGRISMGFCPHGICATSGAYIVFDENYKTYRQDLLKYLIEHEEMAIQKHTQDRKMYFDLLFK